MKIKGLNSRLIYSVLLFLIIILLFYCYLTPIKILGRETELAEQERLKYSNEFIKSRRWILTKNVSITEKIFLVNNGLYRLTADDLIKGVMTGILDENDSAIDVGVADGRFLDVMRDMIVSGKVLGFEPSPNFYSQLIERYKDKKNVKIEDCALFDKSGTEKFYLYDNNWFESGLSERKDRMRGDSNVDNGECIEFLVKVRKLDEYIDYFENLKFIKIDAESAEMNILLGSREIINKFRPVIIVEFGDGVKYFNHKTSELYDFVESTDYFLCDIFGSIFKTEKDWNKYLPCITWDYLLIPKERYEEYVKKIREGIFN